MGFYISAKTGGYYEGDQANWRDPDVPQRPSSDHQWQDGMWVYIKPSLEPTELELLQGEVADLKARLEKAEADIDTIKTVEVGVEVK